jgi:hypothetical protein
VLIFLAFNPFSVFSESPYGLLKVDLPVLALAIVALIDFTRCRERFPGYPESFQTVGMATAYRSNAEIN